MLRTALRRSFSLLAPLLLAAAPGVAGGVVGADPDGGDEPIRREWRGTRPALVAAPVAGAPRDGTAQAAPGPLPEATLFSVEQAPDGDLPRAAAWTPDGSRLLVVNRDTDNLVIHDGATLAPIATVAVGDFPTSVAVTPDGATAVVTNVLDDTLSIVDVATAQVTATVALSGSQPFRVRITGDGTRAVVAVINDALASQLSIVEIGSATEVAAVTVGGMGSVGFAARVETGAFINFFTDFALTPAGLAACYDRAADTVHVVDAMTGSLVGSTLVPAGPDAIDVTPDGTRAVVGCETAEEIAIVDLATATLLQTWPVGSINDRMMRVTPDGDEAVFFSGNLVTFASLATGSIVGTVDHQSFVRYDLAFTADGDHLLVGSTRARVIDVATHALATTIVAPFLYGLAPRPTDDRLAGIAMLDDQVALLDGDGASGAVLDVVAAGEPAEGDDPFGLAIAPGGGLAVVGCLTSGNAAIVELPAGTVRSWVPCGARVKHVAISPDGQRAIVLAMDANAIVVIDLATDAILGTLFVNDRPGRVRFGPDSSEAYVLNIAGSDRVSFIELEPVPQIVAQVSAGQTGAANGPTWTELSGMELTADGAILGVCDSFNDALRLYDVASRTLVATVPTGDFPLHVAFTPDGSRAFVTNHFGDSVTVIDVDGAASAPIATISGMLRYPLEVAVAPDGAHVFVATRNTGGQGDDAVWVIDAATFDVVDAVLGFDGYPRTMDVAADGTLRIATTGATLAVVPGAGPGSTAIAETILLPGGPKSLAHDDASDRAVVVGPSADLLAYLGDAAPPCPADLDGSGDVGFDDLLAILGGWGGPGAADLDGSGEIGFGDLVLLLAAWGPC